MHTLLQLLTAFGCLTGFLPLMNRIMYEVTKSIGDPTVIAGLGWTLDVSPLNSLWWQIPMTILFVAAAIPAKAMQDKKNAQR